MGATSRVSNATQLKTHGVFKETTQEQYAVVKEISWEETQLGIGMDTVMSNLGPGQGETGELIAAIKG